MFLIPLRSLVSPVLLFINPTKQICHPMAHLHPLPAPIISVFVCYSFRCFQFRFLVMYEPFSRSLIKHSSSLSLNSSIIYVLRLCLRAPYTARLNAFPNITISIFLAVLSSLLNITSLSYFVSSTHKEQHSSIPSFRTPNFYLSSVSNPIL